MKINCLIVDDEPASREILEKYIQEYQVLTLVKACKNAFEASEVLCQADIQLLFLDINMPRLSGMKFYKSLSNPPFVIFTTAYPEYAVEGFEVNAVDYLLKPFPFDRFLKAVNKAIEVIQQPAYNHTISRKFILLKADKRINKVIIDEILYLEAVGDYVKVFYRNTHILVHSTFQDLINQLPTDQILRIHKSYAVSKDKFEAIEGNMIIIGGKQLPIGQSYKENFLNVISG
jgi:DNA-binding LytR/AlgR family response regulator